MQWFWKEMCIINKEQYWILLRPELTWVLMLNTTQQISNYFIRIFQHGRKRNNFVRNIIPVVCYGTSARIMSFEVRFVLKTLLKNGNKMDRTTDIMFNTYKFITIWQSERWELTCVFCGCYVGIKEKFSLRKWFDPLCLYFCPRFSLNYVNKSCLVRLCCYVNILRTKCQLYLLHVNYTYHK